MQPSNTGRKMSRLGVWQETQDNEITGCHVIAPIAEMTFLGTIIQAVLTLHGIRCPTN